MTDENRLLPLFPLPLVQFPGAITPLHIFEPRYRTLLRDVLDGDKTFGIIYQRGPQPPDALTGKPVLVGCSVEVVAHHELEDGRSNIVCVGVQRFRVLNYVDGAPYDRAEVELFDDAPVVGDVSEEINRISRLLWRVITIGRRLGEVSGVADEEPPEFPSDPQLFSTTLSSYLEIEMEEKQELLELVSSQERMRRAELLLESLATDYERRVFAQEVARKNGHTGSSLGEL
ncbi:MAG: LON peptidase substrate-binding domain-containing protein [Acidobacteriota bacterium]